MVQALSEADKVKRIEFVLGQMETDDLCILKLVFSDEVLISETIQYERDFSKVNIFCAFSKNKVFGLSFIEALTVNGQTYLEMSQNWLFPQLEDEAHQLIFQHDGAPPNWH